jgi:hypothetical protein
MTREEILANYTVSDRGTILSPGKFEGEMLYVPYFWGMSMEGGCDEIEQDGVMRGTRKGEWKCCRTLPTESCKT